MILSFLVRWASCWMVLVLADRLLSEIASRPPQILVMIALCLSFVGTAVYYLLTPARSLSTLLLIDLILYAWVLLGISYAIPWFFISHSAALTMGLLLTALEWMFYRVIHLQEATK
ncbi:hypothetical protein [Marininema halotolerans]|uniref:4 TMS phage holin, superfamily IV n=1 Tax=Marininema halotolerans TaxID=1155944 RepID=A0A1I6P227_9BACL|nr:hypothetical protein [Marininema halotolerans]SFS34213.1 hypothetical protein SAMN05444972_101307 [Marininema halotolerans]